MIVDERIITFINSMDTENSEILEQIEKEARADSVPIIRREMQSFLKTLLMIKKPMRILEVGTAVGFSALLMSEYAPEECRITTIENYEKRIPIARENFRRAGKAEKSRADHFLRAAFYFCGGPCRHPEPVLQPGQRPDQRVPRQNGF